jgi:hypothetical protein
VAKDDPLKLGNGRAADLTVEDELPQSVAGAIEDPHGVTTWLQSCLYRNVRSMGLNSPANDNI